MESTIITLKKILDEVEEKINKIKSIPVNDSDFLDGEECFDAGKVKGRYEELVWVKNLLSEFVEQKPDTKQFLLDDILTNIENHKKPADEIFNVTYNQGLNAAKKIVSEGIDKAVSDALDTLYKNADETNGKWILCKDSLPTEDRDYLCTMKTGQMLVCRYSWNCPYTRDWFFFGDRRVRPVAWYTGKLPIAYKADGADYEDLEEQGLLLRLPCKVGDTVYSLDRFCGGYSSDCPSRPCKSCPDYQLEIYETTFKLNDIYEFNKTVFLTREEAEAALKKVN